MYVMIDDAISREGKYRPSSSARLGLIDPNTDIVPFQILQGLGAPRPQEVSFGNPSPMDSSEYLIIPSLPIHTTNYCHTYITSIGVSGLTDVGFSLL